MVSMLKCSNLACLVIDKSMYHTNAGHKQFRVFSCWNEAHRWDCGYCTRLPAHASPELQPRNLDPQQECPKLDTYRDKRHFQVFYHCGLRLLCYTGPPLQIYAAGIPVSPECRDLLSKILVGNPEKRFTIQQIQRHPWYTKDLPPGVIQMNAECLKLRHHSAGYQTDTEINSIIMQAIGTRNRRQQLEEDDVYLDEVMVRHRFLRFPLKWLKLYDLAYRYDSNIT